jgi:mRNA interferase MazF
MDNKQEHVKDFNGWNRLKQKIDAKTSPPFFSEGQVWWCSLGVNVGFEIYGKSCVYTRPVLILKKYSRQTFFGLPMSSKRKDRTAYYPIDFQGSEGSLILDQGRTLDSRRLIDRMGEFSEDAFMELKEAFKKHV